MLFADGRFDWNDLLQDAASMSLFAERRVVDVRVSGGKLGREASEAVRRYAARPPDDTLLLMRMGQPAPLRFGDVEEAQFANAALVAGLLTVPATVGELWIVGYLILFGVRAQAHAMPERDSAT